MSSEKSGSKKSPSGNAKITNYFNKTTSPHSATSSPATSKSNEDKTTGGQSTRLRTDVVLPQNKIRVIMKSSPEIDNIGADSVFLIAKATELFIDHLTTTANAACKGTKNIQYKNLSDVVHKHRNLEFLRGKDIIPFKMPARAALAELAKQTAKDEELLK